MATSLEKAVSSVGKIKLATQAALWHYVDAVLMRHAQFSEFQTKLDVIDMAYARYTEKNRTFTDGNGVDNYRAGCGNEECGNVFASDRITPPIVVAQVDTYVAYLADVFLSGSPLFPVVSNPTNRMYAEQLETLLDDHANIGGYARQLLLFIRDGVKYNYSALEVDWTNVDEFSIDTTFEGNGRKLNRGTKKYNALRRLNPRNVLRDLTVPIGDIAKLGDHAGYVEYVSRNRVRSELNRYHETGECYNFNRIINSVHPDSPAAPQYYRPDPIISDYIATTDFEKNGNVNWNLWWDNVKVGNRVNVARINGMTMERVCLYARLVPEEFDIQNPSPKIPQVFKLVFINGIMATCQRLVTAYNSLPILFGQPLEDGLNNQTQSVAEGEIPFQEGAATLFNIRFASARRAVSDRALYDAEHISSDAVNAKGAAPKIPVRLGTLSKKSLDDIYKSIPFQPQGLETVLQDAQVLTNWSKELHGGNNPRQGQFQKGNKSVREWEDTMAGSDQRYRLPALTLEHQVMQPMKSMMVLNIYQYGDNIAVVSQRTGQVLNINIDELRKQVLSFRVADGYSPKSKLASVDAVTVGMQTLMNSPQLQQAYGVRLPGMFAHMMQLMGVRGFEEYDPTYAQQQQQQNANLPGNLDTNTLGTIPAQANAAPSLPTPMATPTDGSALPTSLE